jgi:glycosyltransferase involved in cell wall biosynthesis
VTLAASPDLAHRARELGARDVRYSPVAAPARTPLRRDRESVRAELGARDRPLVLAVGRLAEQKDYPLLLDAARLLAGRDPVPLVVIAGEGPLRGALARRIEGERLPVRLLGERDDVADLLAAADVVAMTSSWEARPLVAQEALAAGVPLVATAVGGVSDLVGDAALLVAPEVGAGAAQVAAAVSRVLDSPALAAELVERGRRRAASWPGEDDTVAAVLSAYTAALARRSGRRPRR